VTIYGDDYPTHDGTCIRDYIHVSDLAKVHLMALDALKKSDSLIYNVGTGKGTSVREVVNAAQKVTKKEIPVSIASRRPGDPAVLVASPEKLCRELGWQPEYPCIEDIISTAWDWHRTHPHGYRSATRSKATFSA